MCDKISNPSHCPRHGPGVYAFVSTFVSPKSDCTVEPSLCNARCSGQLCKSSTPMIQSPEVIKHYTDRDDMYCLPQIQCHSNIPKYNFFQLGIYRANRRTDRQVGQTDKLTDVQGTSQKLETTDF